MILKTEMLFYQSEAVDKLLPIRVGALYMDMGTGKTRTALEIIQRRLTAGKLNRVLWLCPCSIQANIAENIAEHADGVGDLILIRGLESISGSARLHAELVTYVVGGSTMLVVDESSMVKNPFALRSQRITQLAEACRYRMILSGTPVSKNEADLFSQWYILDWRILGYRSYWSFARNHLEYDERIRGKVRRVLNVDYLTDKIAPYTYEVKKGDCLELPLKHYHTWNFDLNRAQNRHYEIVRDEFLDLLMAEDPAERGYSTAVYRTLVALQEVTSGRRIISKAKDPIKHAPFYNDFHDNPRIECLLDLVEDMKDTGQSVIWCRFDHEIRDVETVLSERFGADNVRLFCGSLPMRERQKSLDAFQSGIKFLVANKACAGFGLNLQYCHTAVYYANDWDWGTRAQSEDRLHRLGQTHEVNLYDICSDAGIDSRVLSCLSRKESLADSFKEALKSKNAMAWLEGRDVGDTDRADG